MHLHKCDHVNFFLLGGGVVRLTAKPRYLLLHHRGKEKSNTVTALVDNVNENVWMDVTAYVSDVNSYLLTFVEKCMFCIVADAK